MAGKTCRMFTGMMMDMAMPMPNGCLPQDCEIELVRFSGLFRGSIKEHFKQGAAGLPAFLFRMEEE